MDGRLRARGFLGGRLRASQPGLMCFKVTRPIPAGRAAARGILGPFPGRPGRLPSLAPTSSGDPAHDAYTAAWDVLRAYDRPFLCAFSDGDPIFRGVEAMFIDRVPGAAGQPHTTIEGAGHFLQEDQGEQLARVIAAT